MRRHDPAAKRSGGETPSRLPVRLGFSELGRLCRSANFPPLPPPSFSLSPMRNAESTPGAGGLPPSLPASLPPCLPASLPPSRPSALPPSLPPFNPTSLLLPALPPAHPPALPHSRLHALRPFLSPTRAHACARAHTHTPGTTLGSSPATSRASCSPRLPCLRPMQRRRAASPSRRPPAT